MAEPTGRLTYGDILLDIAIEMGVAEYGAGGTGAAAIPTDAHDLAEIGRMLNKGIRMFMADAPRSGWRWTRPIASINLWSSVAQTTKNPGVTFDLTYVDPVTEVTTTKDTFFPSMNGKKITLGTTDHTMTYVNSKKVTVVGDQTAETLMSITADGDYTLPDSFGGQVHGKPVWAAGTNVGSHPSWSDEATIRGQRVVGATTSDPAILAFRPRADRLGYDLMAWPTPSANRVLEFTHDLYFTKVDPATDTALTPPSPYIMDEALTVACLSAVELNINRQPGHWTALYNQRALPQAHTLDKQSAPKTVGILHDPGMTTLSIQDVRSQLPRNTVTFGP